MFVSVCAIRNVSFCRCLVRNKPRGTANNRWEDSAEEAGNKHVSLGCFLDSQTLMRLSILNKGVALGLSSYTSCLIKQMHI